MRFGMDWVKRGLGWVVRVGGLLALGCGDGQSGSNAQQPEQSPMPGLVVPLLSSYVKWDYHVFQGLDDHPRFEMVELMLDDAHSDDPLAWVFFTERAAPKRQFHYTNRAEHAESLSATSSPETRIVHTTPIEVTWEEQEDGRLAFHVELSTEDGAVRWDVLSTGAPNGDYAQLISQSGHDLAGGILVMYLHDTVLIDPSTTLVQGGQTWPSTVWQEKSSAYFTAYNGAVSPRLGHGYLVSGEASYRLLSKPRSLEVAEGWRYEYQDERGAEEQHFTIEERQGNMLKVAAGPFGFAYETVETGLSLRSVGVTDEDGGLLVRFEPPLPDLEHQEPGFVGEVSFAVDIDQVVDVITGKVLVKVEAADAIQLLLSPEQPSWAVTNPMRISIGWNENGYEVRSQT